MIKRIMNNIDRSVSNFHCVEVLVDELLKAGYKEVYESNIWDMKFGKFFVRKNNSSLIAFDISEKLTSHGFNIVASHTDFPTFKIKPIASIHKEGFVQLNTEPYGGMLLSTFFDRPLGIAGRVITSENGVIKTNLVNIDKDLCFIPSLAIHQNRTANESAKYNPQNDMLPILGLSGEKIEFKDILENETGLKNILSYDLNLVLREKSKLVGLNEEFLMSAHLDNMLSVFTSLESLINSSNNGHINVLSAFDNEEVGSMTKQGANSTFLADTLKRISLAIGKSELEHLSSLTNSFMISADNAHAVHPNYLSVVDPTNKCYINKGIAIKSHSGFSYTSDAVSIALFIELCKKSNKEYQIFTNRSDIRGGSTLGSISSTQVSINSVDIGIPQFAMHSSYETCGVKDVIDTIDILSKFYSTNINSTDNNNITLS